MRDVDTELQDLLRRKAREVDAEPNIPPRVLGRARRRRAGTALLSGTVAAALILSGVVGTRAAMDLFAGGDTRPGAGPQTQWRGIWPQETGEMAEVAQANADEGMHDAEWQLVAREVMTTYGQEILGWDRVVLDERLDISEDESGPLTIRMGDCRAVTTEGCPREVEITIERLLRRDRTGIWSVTSVERLPGRRRGEASD